MKKMVSILLAICMGFSLAACGGTKTSSGSAGQASQDSSGRTTKARDGQDSKDSAGQKGQDPEEAAGPKGQDLSDETAQAPDGQDSEDAGAPVVYGNEPNNLLQLSNAVCIGEGRVYYVNSDDEVASIALDGSDEKTVGAIENLTQASSGAHSLNWYNGCVYYIITQYTETGCYLEIRSMDASTGAETIVLQTEEDNFVSDGMLIIGDNLFYAGYDSGSKKAAVTAFNLVTQEKNQIMKTTATANGDVAFSSDGKYLYVFIPNTFYDVYRIALSEVGSSEPSCEQAANERTSVIILDENGYYATVENSDTHEIGFVFYDYKDSGEDWQYGKLLDDVASDGDMSEEKIIPNLIWYSNMWPVGGSLASMLMGNKKTLYYSPSADFTQSAAVGGIELAYGEVLHAGTYEGTLYMIIEGTDGLIFHTLTADGNYK